MRVCFAPVGNEENRRFSDEGKSSDEEDASCHRRRAGPHPWSRTHRFCGGGVEPNVDTFEPFTLIEIMSGLEYGVVGEYPFMPPSEAIGSDTWEWGEDALFTIDYGNNKMRIFHAQNLSSNTSAQNFVDNFQPEYVFMDGNTIVGLNMEPWLESISTESLVVRYESVAMDSFDQGPTPDDLITSTRAVWFQSPNGLWVAATKSRYTIHLNLDFGADIDVVITELNPNYYLQTERDAEVIARIVLGDFEFCIGEPGTQKVITPCTLFSSVPIE